MTDAALVARLRAAGCVFAEDEAAELEQAAAGDPELLSALLERRVAGEPLEYVVGQAGFCGLRIAVDPGVFVPRRRTELLARRAAALLRPGSVLVDQCCGTGAVALAAVTLAGVSVQAHAVDIDPVAVACAERNLAAIGGRAYCGDLFVPLPEALHGRVDVLSVNAPYVPTEAIAQMPREARLFEATVALDGGPDGLDVQRRAIAAASEWLAPTGRVLVETGRAQAARTAGMLRAAGFEPRRLVDDELAATVVVGTRAQPDW